MRDTRTFLWTLVVDVMSTTYATPQSDNLADRTPVLCVFHRGPIPSTREQQHVGIPKKSTGDKVNLEVDVLGKYVERSLSSVLDRLGALEEWKQVGQRCPRLPSFMHKLSSIEQKRRFA